VARTRLRLAGWLGSLAIAFSCLGCASKGPETVDTAVERMREMRSSLGTSKNQIDNTVRAMNTMVREPMPDMKPQYANFTTQLGTLESQGQAIQKRASSFREQRNAYLTAWDAELASVQSPELKAKGKERSDAIRATIAKMEEASGKARDAYNSMMRDLKDIRTYLSHDLNATGIDSVKKQAQGVTDQAETVKKLLDELIAEIDSLSNRISSKKMG
jgi:chromosome segregation ATPase